MKFATSLIVLAVAVSINASVIPLGLSTVQVAGIPTVISAGPSAVPAGYAISSAPGSLAVSSSIAGNVISAAPAAIQIASAPAAIQLAPAPAAIQLAAPSPVIIAAHAPATYTAANRGTVHVSELPGHTISKASINLEPAPGTI